MSIHLILSRIVDVRSIPAEGVEHRIVATSEQRARLVEAFGLVELSSLEVDLLVKAEPGKKVRVTGRVGAELVQNCVVSFVPVQQKMDEAIDVAFVPENKLPVAAPDDPVDLDSPEPFDGRTLDIGAVALEHFALGIDPYPRAPGAELAVPDDSNRVADWAAPLAALTRENEGSSGGKQ